MSANNLWAGAIVATGVWAASAATIITSDGAPPREMWVVTSSEKQPSHPTLVRAAVPRSLARAADTRIARQERAQLLAMK